MNCKDSTGDVDVCIFTVRVSVINSDSKIFLRLEILSVRVGPIARVFCKRTGDILKFFYVFFVEHEILYFPNFNIFLLYKTTTVTRVLANLFRRCQ